MFKSQNTKQKISKATVSTKEFAPKKPLSGSPISEADFKEWVRFLGDNPEREGLSDSYRRFIESRIEIFSGYHRDPAKAITLFDSEGYDEMIICRDIDFFSNCEHHLLPFYGHAHIGYIPDESIIGLSKFSRINF